MKLWLRILVKRMRASGLLVPLRLMGLVLAAVLAAAVPAFVDASMQQVLRRQVEATPDSLDLVLTWAATESRDYGPAIRKMDEYLTGELFPSGGRAQVRLLRLEATGQRVVQQVGPDNAPLPGRRYFRLGFFPNMGPELSDPAHLTLVEGRLPKMNAAEVALLDTALAKGGYTIGDRLRVPLTTNSSGKAVFVTIVGTVQFGPESGWANLSGTAEGTLFTSSQYWDSLGLRVEEATWAVRLPQARLTTGILPAVAEALRALPLRATRILPDTEVVVTPITWMDGYMRQVRTTEQMLVVVLLPIHLLVAVFGWATAEMVVRNRTLEVAVQRSRGVRPLEILGSYVGEGLLLVSVATALTLVLIGPIVQVLGLSAGFLKLVNRPPLPVDVTVRTAAYAASGAMFVEFLSWLPLLRATRLTVATVMQEAHRSGALEGVLRTLFEVILLALLAIGTNQVLTTKSASEPLDLTLPGLFLVGIALACLRCLDLLIGLAMRLVGSRLSASAYLALSLLRKRSSRYQTVWIMLIVTTGLGIYGASLARTLDSDLVTAAQYRLGSDLRIRPLWETEVVPGSGSGEPDELIYHEPPYSQFQHLAGSIGTARVQWREDVSLYAGSRNLGKVDLQAIHPQEFGRAARFINGLPQSPQRFLEGMANDERAVLVSHALADRLDLKPGDSLLVKDTKGEAEVIVTGVVPAWPGRLPDDGDFLVSNLEYIQDNLGLFPYEIWVRLEHSDAASSVAAELKERNARVVDIGALGVEVARGRREPLRLGLYGMLSAGFVVALLIMTLSYLLNVGTVLSSRTKELGVLRAMGMSERDLARSLYLEQLLLLGTAVGVGLAAGTWAGALYVPALRRQPGTSVFLIPAASAASEGIVLAVGGLFVLGIGLVIVAVWIRRLAIGKALRLGEDG